MDNTSLLRAGLRLNALFSISTGTLAVAYAHSLETLLNFPATALTALGVVLCVYAVGLLALSFIERVASPWTVGATALDFLWVFGSLALVGLGDVPTPGLVLATAAVVLACAIVQLLGLRRATFTNGFGHFELEREICASPASAWSVVSDVARYAEFAGTLHKSTIVSGEGLGLVRRCEDKSGVCWVETCVRWEKGRALAFDVDTSGPGYPLPLRTMRGDFEVDALSERRSMVRIRFTFTTRGGAWTELCLALIFALSGDRLVGAILRRWAQELEGSGVDGYRLRLACD